MRDNEGYPFDIGVVDFLGERSWLQDTSKRKPADLFFLRPPSLFPRANPMLTRRLIKTGAPNLKIRVG